MKITFMAKYYLIAAIFISSFSAEAQYADDPGTPDSIIVGNLDGSHINVYPGDTITVPIWVKNDEDIGNISVPIAADDEYIVNWANGNIYGQITNWPLF